MKKDIYLLMFKEDSSCGDIGDKIVSIVTSSPYSHVAILVSSNDDDRTLYESHIDFNTRKVINWNGIHECWDRYRLDIPADEVEEFIKNLEQLVIAKPKYNLLGALLSPIMGLKRKNKVFCSEFVAEALGYNNPERFTPISLFKFLKEKKILNYVGWGITRFRTN